MNMSELDIDNKDYSMINADDAAKYHGLYHHIYQQINNKMESTTKFSSANLLIEYADIQQLHYKIEQIKATYDVKVESFSMTIYYCKKKKETYSSFERYDVVATEPTLGVELIYDFSIKPAGINRNEYQHYKIKIDLDSRIGRMHDLELIDDNVMPSTLRYLIATQSSTALIKVEYATLVIAKNFVDGFNDWVESCSQSKIPKYIKFLKTKSRFIPTYGSILFATIFGWIILHQIDWAVSDVSNKTLFILSIYAAIGFYIYNKITINLLKAIRNKIDSYLALSYINLTTGDKKLINEKKQENKKNIMLFVMDVGFVLVINIFSNFLYAKFFH
jgi:hypothetical protein